MTVAMRAALMSGCVSTTIAIDPYVKPILIAWSADDVFRVFVFEVRPVTALVMRPKRATSIEIYVGLRPQTV